MTKIEKVDKKEAVNKTLEDQFALRIFKAAPEAEVSHEIYAFSDDSEFWSHATKRLLKSGDLISLNKVHLMEWFPRVPGLYHQKRSHERRIDALQFVDEELSSSISNLDDEGSFSQIYRYSPYANIPFGAYNWSRFSQGHLDARFASIERNIVFNPRGKRTMLENGIGSVRLAPFEHNGEVFWFCSASSIGWSDQGIPLVIPEKHFDTVAAEIRETGCALCDIEGRVKILYAGGRDTTAAVAQHLKETIFDSYHGLTRIYIHVDAIKKKYNQSDKKALKACAALSFISSYEAEQPQTYATYVSFIPGDGRNFDESIDWMTEYYIFRRYKGTIITDFDQQAPSFSEALFSLKFVSSEITSHDVSERLGKIGIQSITQEIKQFITIDTLYGAVNDMSKKTTNTTVTNSGVAGIIAGGDVSGGTATVTSTTNSAPADLERLLKLFSDAVSTSGLSVSRKNLLQSQLDILQEEGAKKSENQDKGTVTRALDDIKTAAGAANALKELWDKFGGDLMKWFA